MRRRWIPAVAGLAALGVAAATAGGRGRELDRRAYRALNGIGGPVTDSFFKALTEMGSLFASAGAAVVLAGTGRRREAVDAMGAAGAMWLLGQGVKRLYLRPRPYHAMEEHRLLIGRPRGTSWPSSHPAVLLAFASVAARDVDVPPSMRAALVALAGAVGLSRVYLGVHYPSDVVGGLLLGRGVADLWSSTVSPRVLGRLPSVSGPGTVSG